MAVQVTNLTKCKFHGGSISGFGVSGTVGLSVTAAYIAGAFGLTIDGLGWAVRITPASIEPSFIDCAFTDNVDGAVNLAAGDDTVTYGMRLIGCHMAGGSPPQFIQVDEGCTWNGGVVLGCTFGEASGGSKAVGSTVAGAASSRAAGIVARRIERAVGPYGATSATAAGVKAGASSKATTRKIVPSGGTARSRVASPAAAVTRTGARTAVHLLPGASHPLRDTCIFRVTGELAGVVVSGCSSVAPARGAVWNIADGSATNANASQTCDMFNDWVESTVATGNKATRLVRMTTNAFGQLSVTATSTKLDSDELGFFGVAPTIRGDTYRVAGSRGSSNRRLTTGNVQQVLAQLLLDLNELGLVQTTPFVT